MISRILKHICLFYDPLPAFFHLPYYNNNRTMDLPYPSQRDEQLTSRLSPQDRRRSAVLKDSLRLLPSSPPLPKQLRIQLATFINEDMAFELRETIQKEVVSLRAEAGKEGSFQTLLHVACRYDAVRCLNYMLHTYYQYFPEDYESWVNAPNRQGVTAAMLCVLSHSESSLETLLRAGGVDIHIIDSNKLSAYQLALNCKNQPAVRMLMDYENGSKKTKLINHELLSQTYELKPTKLGWCQSIYRCLLNCLTFGHQELPTKARRKAASVLSGGLQGLFMEQVELGYTAEQLGGEVQWKLMGQYQQRGKIGILFDTFSPFDMEDILHPSGHLLIILQSLSQHPWLVRRLIQPDRSRSGYYNVILQDGTNNRSICVDSYLPFTHGGSQPLFLADKKQGWPMILQKALAKHFGSYSQLSNLPAQKLMEVLTGWPTIRKQVEGGRKTVQYLQQLNSHGFMYILQGRVNSLLSSPTCIQSCFTVLTFYSRGDKRLVLVNCPFVDPAWVQKEKNQNLALKIMRGHYNCRDQMTIWVEEDRLRQYFSAILVCPIKSGQQKQTATVSCKDVLHFRLTVETGNQQGIIGYLLDEAGGLVSFGTIEGWRNEKNQVKMIEEVCRQNMLHFDGKQGEYMFRVTPPPGKYQLVFWSDRELRIESLEETFGALEWIACLRQASAYNWTDCQKYLVNRVGDLSLLMVMGNGNYYASIGGQVLEGRRNESGAVELIREDSYGYCVLKGKVEEEPTFYQA